MGKEWWPVVFSGLLGAVVGGLLTSVTALFIFRHSEKASNERQRLDRLRDAAVRFVQFASGNFISSLNLIGSVDEMRRHFEALTEQRSYISNPPPDDAALSTRPSGGAPPAQPPGLTPDLMEQYTAITADLNALSANVASTQVWGAIRSELRLVAPKKIFEEADKIVAISSWRQLDTTSDRRRTEAAKLFGEGVTVFVNSVRREMGLGTFEVENDKLEKIYDRVEELYRMPSNVEDN